MENKIKNIGLCVAIILSILSCGKEELNIDYNLAKPEYTLPMGKPGSVEEQIYNIHKEYGTFILYDFEESDLKYIWTSSWNKVHTPANTTEDKKYIRRFINAIDKSVFQKYEADFIRSTFPYKVFLVDTLYNYFEADKSKIVNMLSNGQNAIAISNVGVASEDWEEKDWQKFEIELSNMYTKYYFNSLSKKPLAFIASKWPSLLFPNVDNTSDGEYTDYQFNCYSAGLMFGQNMISYLTPKDDQDYGDYIAFLTGNTATEIKRVFELFPLVKSRSIILEVYLSDVVNLSVVGTQNKNNPDDKLPIDFFDTLQ